ncbi:hypothetical protein CHS0354_025228 [Potamilus streckersoni]|uniref:Uncharacterized protein n=1 Tax=Potamilus streckersoni TaxID=2493646 RepID=A0AAE0T1U9_9BIVA|nr:hypothetical protein CHS0354_025228 [Potamilus streckersoni]
MTVDDYMTPKPNVKDILVDRSNVAGAKNYISEQIPANVQTSMSIDSMPYLGSLLSNSNLSATLR